MCLCFMLSFFILVVAEKPLGKYVKFSLKEIQALMAPPKQNRAFASPEGTTVPGQRELSLNSHEKDDRGSRRSKRSARRSHLALNADSNKSRGSNRSAQEDLIFFDSDNEEDLEAVEGYSVGEGAGSQTGPDQLRIHSKTPTNQEAL